MVGKVLLSGKAFMTVAFLMMWLSAQSYASFESDIFWDQVCVSPDGKWVAYKVIGVGEDNSVYSLSDSVLVTEVATGKTRVVAQHLKAILDCGDYWALETPWGLFRQAKEPKGELPVPILETYRSNECLGNNCGRAILDYYLSPDATQLIIETGYQPFAMYSSVDGASATVSSASGILRPEYPQKDRIPMHDKPSWPLLIPVAKDLKWLQDGRLVMVDCDNNVYALNVNTGNMEWLLDWKPAYCWGRLDAITIALQLGEKYERNAQISSNCTSLQAFTRRRCMAEHGSSASDEIWLWDGDPSHPPRLLVPARGNWTPRFP